MKYPCGECDYQAPQPFSLKQHQLTVHSGQQLLACQQCSFRQSCGASASGLTLSVVECGSVHTGSESRLPEVELIYLNFIESLMNTKKPYLDSEPDPDLDLDLEEELPMAPAGASQGVFVSSCALHLQFSLHLGVSHQFSFVFFCMPFWKSSHFSHFHFTWYLILAFDHSVGEEVAPHLQSVRLWS